MIKALIFDVGGVLITYAENTSVTALINKLQITKEKYEEAFANMRSKLTLGNITENEGWKSFCEEINRTEDINFLKQEYRRQYEEHLIKNNLINKELLDLIYKLKSTGYKLGVLANTTVMNTDVYRKLGLYGDFDQVVLSYEEKAKKPNPLFFKEALKKLNVRAEESFFIDDLERHILAAKDIGIEGVQYINNKDLFKIFSELEIMQD